MILDPTDFILCGMPSELAVLCAAFPRNPVHGGDAKTRLSALVPPGCRRIISCGLGGGLSPKIRIAGGAVADMLTSGSANAGTCFPCDTAWNHAVMDLALSPAEIQEPWARDFVECPWWYSSGVMDEGDTTVQRATLLAETGAWGIDDESFAAGVFCASHPDVKLNVLRFCSDDASETLPLAARGQVMNANGSPNMPYIWKELVSEGLVEDLQLLRVAADGNASLAALQACARAIAGPA